MPVSQYPQLKTNRLILGKLSYTDIPKIIEYAGNEKVAGMTLNIPYPYHEKDAIFWLNMANQGFADKSQYTFGIRIRDSKEFIGGIGLVINKRFNRAELGYWLAEPFWNKGYITEAVGAILTFGFEELELNKIFAIHLFENPASGKVMIKNGMIKEGKLIGHIRKHGIYQDVFQYRLTKEEFEQLKK